jgi:hypothetical protein
MHLLSASLPILVKYISAHEHYNSVCLLRLVLTIRVRALSLYYPAHVLQSTGACVCELTKYLQQFFQRLLELC